MTLILRQRPCITFKHSHTGQFNKRWAAKSPTKALVGQQTSQSANETALLWNQPSALYHRARHRTSCAVAAEHTWLNKRRPLKTSYKNEEKKTFIDFEMFTTASVLKLWSNINLIWSWTTHVAPLHCFRVNMITHPEVARHTWSAWDRVFNEILLNYWCPTKLFKTEHVSLSDNMKKKCFHIYGCHKV